MLAGRGRHQVKTRQLIQGDVERVAKVFELLLLRTKEMLVRMVKDIVEGEQHGLDGLVTLDPAVLGLLDSTETVGNAGAEMKNKAPLFEWERLNMLVLQRLGQKTVGQPSIFFMEVMIEMATEEEAGVPGDERQEAGFPRGVAESLNVRDGIEGRHYRSKIS